MRKYAVLLVIVLVVVPAYAEKKRGVASKQSKSEAAVSTKSTGLPKDDELYRTIAKLDGELFSAYNNCELEKFGSFLPDELEFYHDNGGNPQQTRAMVLEAIKNNICNKVQRELVSLEVYPMKDFGAVEIGVHRFRHPGREKDTVGEAQFVHLWQNKNGKWLLTRVISFDHRSLGQ